MSLEPHGQLVPAGGGDTIPLVRADLKIGRRSSCDICLKFSNVSNIHCQLSFREGYWYVRDLNSTNGVKVNGTRVQEKLLHPEDTLAIGKRVFVIHYNLPTTGRASQELEEDILSEGLLERAGLEKKKKRNQGRSFDPGDFLLEDDDDDDEFLDDDD